MVRAYTWEEITTAIRNCGAWMDCYLVTRAVMADKDHYTQDFIDMYLRETDKRIIELSRQNKL